MLLRHVLSYAASRVVPGLVNVLALALYTRWLDSTAFGRYALVLAAAALGQLVIFGWLRLGMLRFYERIQHDGHLSVLFSTVAGGFALASIVVSTAWVVVLASLPLDAGLKSALYLGLPLLLAQSLFEQTLSIHIAGLNPLRYAVLIAKRAVMGLAAAALLLLVLGLAERGIILGLILGNLVAASIDLPQWCRQVRPHLIERKMANELLRYGMPLTAALGLSFILTTSDRFLIEYFLGASSVGLYTAGYDLTSQALTSLFMIVNLAAYPLAIRALERDGVKAAQAQLRQNGVLFLGVALPATAGLCMISSSFAGLILGGPFRATAAEIIPWIALAFFLAGFRAYYLDVSFQLARRTSLQVWPIGAAALVNITLNIWWLPVYGVMGAVYATVVAFAIAFAGSLILSFRVFPLPFPLGDWCRLLMATLSMVAVLWFIPTSATWSGLGLAVLSGVMTYTLALCLTNPARFRQRALDALISVVLVMKNIIARIRHA